MSNIYNAIVLDSTGVLFESFDYGVYHRVCLDKHWRPAWQKALAKFVKKVGL